MTLALDAFVTDIVMNRTGPAYALGDGTIAWADGKRTTAHDGSILCAAAHPSGAHPLDDGVAPVKAA